MGDERPSAQDVLAVLAVLRQTWKLEGSTTAVLGVCVKISI